MPEHGELISRVETVLRALYLLFNEGYKTSQGHELVRKELCEEAIRLGTLLAEHPAGNQPKTHALLALMLFNAARLTTRSDAAGNLLLLAQQDRTLWNQEMIDRGFMHLDQSAAGTEISEFHLEAGIASCHCSAQSYEETNWLRILSLYDSLTEMNSSPVIALNRAVAISNVHGPAAGILAVESIGEREMLDKYYLYHAVLGRLHFKLKHFEEAARRFRRASELTAAKAEQAFLQTKLNECDATLGTDLVLSDERQQYRRTP